MLLKQWQKNLLINHLEKPPLYVLYFRYLILLIRGGGGGWDIEKSMPQVVLVVVVVVTISLLPQKLLERGRDEIVKKLLLCFQVSAGGKP